MRAPLLAMALVIASSAPAAAQTRSPDRAATMTAIAQAESQRAATPRDSVTLRVPVKLSAMLPEAQRVSVHCSVSGPGGNGSERSAIRTIANGEFDQVIVVVVPPHAGKTLIGAKSFICRLEIYGPGGVMNNPSQGGPPSNQLYRLSRPGAFFRVVTSGALDGGAANDGLTGGNGLTAPPRPRQ